jgi:hypothetical protein
VAHINRGTVAWRVDTRVGEIERVGVTLVYGTVVVVVTEVSREWDILAANSWVAAVGGASVVVITG